MGRPGRATCGRSVGIASATMGERLGCSRSTQVRRRKRANCPSPIPPRAGMRWASLRRERPGGRPSGAGPTRSTGRGPPRKGGVDVTHEHHGRKKAVHLGRPPVTAACPKRWAVAVPACRSGRSKRVHRSQRKCRDLGICRRGRCVPKPEPYLEEGLISVRCWYAPGSSDFRGPRPRAPSS